MKKILNLLAVLLFAVTGFSQNFFLNAFMARACKNEAELTSFFKSKGYGDPVIHNDIITYFSREGFSNAAGEKKVPSFVTAAFWNKEAMLILNTKSSTLYYELLEEMKIIGRTRGETKTEKGKDWTYYNSPVYSKYTIAFNITMDTEGTENRFTYQVKVDWKLR